MTINGIVLALGIVFSAFVGVCCYIWGRSDERDARARKIYERRLRRIGRKF